MFSSVTGYNYTNATEIEHTIWHYISKQNALFNGDYADYQDVEDAANVVSFL